MSIGTSHVFNVLDKSSKPIDGQRLVRLIAKGENKSPNLSGSMCISIPVVTAEEVVGHIEALLPYVVGMVQDTQDKIIREYRIESGASDMHENLFDVPHVVEWLAANATGERVTREYLARWFTEDYGEVAHEWIRTLKSSEGATPEVIERKFNVIRDMVASFADARTKHSKPQCKAVLAFAEVVECDSRMTQIRMMAQSQLDKILQAESEALEMFE